MQRFACGMECDTVDTYITPLAVSRMRGAHLVQVAEEHWTKRGYRETGRSYSV